MAKALPKTNGMRILERVNIPYQAHEYPHEDGAVSGQQVAALLGVLPDMVYKTLVTRGASGGYYVFVIPVTGELELKKAARTVGEKSVQMIRQAELFPLTGYVHGGCSPLGMKKQFPTVFSDEIILHDQIIVSGGRIGVQLQVDPQALVRLTDGTVGDVTGAGDQ